MHVSSAVRPRRVAVIGGAGVAVLIAMIFVIEPVPDRIVTLLGGPQGGVDRIGGVKIRYRPPAGMPAAEIDRVLAGRSSLRREGDLLLVDFPGVSEDQIRDLEGVLVGGGLAMREVVDSPLTREIARSAPSQVKLEIDQWSSEDGSRHEQPYLTARSREALQRTIANAAAHGISSSTGSELALEYVEPYQGSKQGPSWRTYELASSVPIDGTMIASAVTADSVYSGRPEVRVEFTRDGAEQFCELTRQIAGRKLAVVIGGRVRSAPIINSAICGGRASITIGGTDPSAQEREAVMLTSVLTRGAVPRGGTIESATWQPATNVALQEWLGRMLLGLLGGSVFGLLAFAVVKAVRPSWSVKPAPVVGGFPYRRLAVTALAPVALVVGSRITLPGINEVELMHVVMRGSKHGFGFGTDTVSVIALGIMPILTSFVIVELVALAIPALRWRRHDPLGRRRLGQAVAAVSVVIALVQGYFVASYLELLARDGAEVVAAPGLKFRVLTMLSLATGTMLLSVVAGMISEHGLGNGYGAVFVAAWALKLMPPVIDGPGAVLPSIDPAYLFALVVIAAIAIGTACVLRWRINGGDRELPLRVPSSGIAPLSDAGGLALAVLTVSTMGLGATLFDVSARLVALRGWTIVYLCFVIGFVPIWSWLFARPALVRAVAMQAGLAAPAPAAWRRATFVSAALMLAVATLGWVASTVDAQVGALANPVMVMIATAVALDIIDDARARRERLAPAGVIHQIQRFGIIERVLADAGIRCHIHASNLRTLFAFFGPWAPAIALVPEAQATEARLKIEGATRAARAQLPRAAVRPSSEQAG